MADTVNVGEVAVEIVARTERMQQGMQKAAASVQTFSKTSVAAVEGFNLKTETMKKLAQGAGGMVSESFGAVAGNIAQMGLVAGGAMVAVQAISGAFTAASANARAAAENNLKFLDVMRSIKEFQSEPLGDMEKQIKSRTAVIDAEVNRLHQQLTDLYDVDTFEFGKFFRGNDQAFADGINAQIQRLQMKKAELMGASQASSVDAIEKAFRAGDIASRLDFANGSLEQMQARYVNIKAAADSLDAALESTQLKGEARVAAEEKWLAKVLEGKQLLEQIVALKQKDYEISEKGTAELMKQMGMQNANNKAAAYLAQEGQFAAMMRMTREGVMSQFKLEKSTVGFGAQVSGGVSVAAMQSAGVTTQRLTVNGMDKSNETLVKILAEIQSQNRGGVGATAS
ncbi:MAG TPA: hypothetical protein VEJ63_15270 [Planctomycetota bacterium]|nr:hypothetical protein [Planctomycetota bacterium]